MSTANASPPRHGAAKRSYSAFSTPARQRSYSDTEAELDARFCAVSKRAYEKRRAETKQGHNHLKAQWMIKTAHKRKSMRRLADANPQDQAPIPCSEEIESFDSEDEVVSPPRQKRFKFTTKTPFITNAADPCKRLWHRPKLKMQKAIFASPDNSQSNDDTYTNQHSDNSSSEYELLDSSFVCEEYTSDQSDEEEQDEHSPKHMLSSALFSEDEADEIPMVTCSLCYRTWDGNAQCPCAGVNPPSSSDSSSSDEDSSDDDDIHASDDDDETNKENYFTSQQY